MIKLIAMKTILRSCNCLTHCCVVVVLLLLSSSFQNCLIQAFIPTVYKVYSKNNGIGSNSRFCGIDASRNLICLRSKVNDANEDPNTNNADVERTAPQAQMKPIMFDEFAREDKYVYKKLREESKANEEKEKEKANKQKNIDENDSSNGNAWESLLNDPDRPTGYSNDNTDEEQENPYIIGTDEEKWATEAEERTMIDTTLLTVSDRIKDVWVDNPYDSRRRRQAKQVVKSITLLSFIIGCIFTFVWYAFPGKFISYRGDTSFTSRYSNYYVDPDDLLNEVPTEENMNSAAPTGAINPKEYEKEKVLSRYLDDGQGLPVKERDRF